MIRVLIAEDQAMVRGALKALISLEAAHEQTRAHGGLPLTFPVPSAGIKATAVAEIVRDFGTDVVVNAGTAVFGHPDGPVAGARSFVRAIEEAVGR